MVRGDFSRGIGGRFGADRIRVRSFGPDGGRSAGGILGRRRSFVGGLILGRGGSPFQSYQEYGPAPPELDPGSVLQERLVRDLSVHQEAVGAPQVPGPPVAFVRQNLRVHPAHLGGHNGYLAFRIPPKAKGFGEAALKPHSIAGPGPELERGGVGVFGHGGQPVGGAGINAPDRKNP